MFQKQFHNLTIALFTLLTGAAFLLGTFHNNAFSIRASAPLMILCCSCYCLISIFILNKCSKWHWKRIYWLTILLFFLQLFLLAFIITPVGWDCGFLISGAKQGLYHTNAKTTDYLSIYPNNLFLFYLERNLFRINDVLHLPFSAFAIMDVINILCIDATIIVTSLLAGQLFGENKILPCYYITVCILGFTPWMIIPYSDTFGMLFPILGCYCYFSGTKCIGLLKPVLLLVSGILFGIGYLIKPTALIAFIAIFLFWILESRITKKVTFLKNILALTSGLILTLTLFQGYTSLQSDPALHTEKKTPLSHFLVLGTHHSVRKDGKELFGTYNERDVQEMLRYHTTKEKHDFSMKKYIKRLQSFGIAGYIKFLFSKFRWITGDGMFSWGIEGNFIKEQDKHSLMSHSIFKELYYPHGRFISITENLFQAIWLGILLFCAIGSLCNQKGVFLTIPRLTCIGTVLFILLFEGRARYLIICIPFFCLMAVSGITFFQTQLAKVKLSSKASD